MVFLTCYSQPQNKEKTMQDDEKQRKVDTIEAGFDALSEPLEQITIAPKSSDIHIHFVGPGRAHIRDAQGRLVPAWL